MRLEKLITNTHSSEKAEAYKAFAPTADELRAFKKIGREALEIIAPIAGACAMMSAAYVARVEHVLKLPAYVVAGSLKIRDTYVFGDGRAFDGVKAFSESNSSWDGHAWVMLGPYVADISIFRTAYSENAHPLLAAHVRREFGDNAGLMVVRWSDAPLSGLYYAPQYVLSDQQVTNLFRGLQAMVTGQR